jgi:hypothetical protein
MLLKILVDCFLKIEEVWKRKKLKRTMQKDYSQFSLNDLYKLYTKELNENPEEGKLIFEEILKKEKKVTPSIKTKNEKFLPVFYLIASARNIIGYFYIYMALRFTIVANIFNITFNYTLKDIMSIFFYIFFLFLIAGTIASTQVKKITGHYNHTKYIKRELFIVLILLILSELVQLN